MAGDDRSHFSRRRPKRPSWRRALPGFGVVVLIAALATVVGLRLWRQTETGIARIETDARAVVQLETLRANTRQLLYRDLTPPNALVADGAMLLPSPHLLRIPIARDETALLRELLQAQVLFRTLEEASAHFHVREAWRVLVLYLRWWIEQNHSKLLGVEAGEKPGERESYATCTPYTLALLSIDTFADYIPSVSEARPSIANVFFDFLVSGKTQGSAPRLLSALGRHETWNSLAPEVFGMSLEELQRTLKCDTSIEQAGFADPVR